MEFFGFRDLRSSEAVEVQPWNWHPKEAQKAVLQAPKASRNQAMARHGWLVYSPVRATVATAHVEASNPVAGVRGMVLDYDVPLIKAHLEKALGLLGEDLTPQYVEQTLSGNFRLVWIFDRDVAVVDATHVEMIWRTLADRINPYELHPGLDSASFRPYQRWTAGADWMCYSEHEHLPKTTLAEILWEVGKKFKPDTKSDISFEKIAEEIQVRWPGVWQGEFVIGARGKRFWDEKADNPMGCMVKPDGFLCFTGPKPVVTWDDLLGQEWCRKAREDRLSDATTNIFFDGRTYWHATGKNLWHRRSREDTMLELQDRGFDNRVTKGKSISDCGRLLNMIQQANRVDAALSLVNYPPGLVTIRRQRLLNTTRVQAMNPADGTATFDDFPWLWEFLQGHFATPENRPLDHFLAWLKRAYIALLERQRLMGQALFLCGPRQNGKTLLATRIIAPMLGEGYADPFEYLTGRTTFNSELFDNFLWCLNDADSPREGERGSVLSKIKDTVVNPSHQYHQKFGDRAQVDWQGRLLITLNDDPGSVALLPEVNSNTADKLGFFASKNYAKAWPTNREIEATLEKELPKFCRWLLDWQEPADVLEASRVGVKSYFDPHVLETSRRQGYAYNFRELLVNWVRASWALEEIEKVLTPTELMANLNSCDPVSALARDWKVPVVARALTTLARDSHSGITYNDGADRSFTIHRSILN
jgi:hypothetical protein